MAEIVTLWGKAEAVVLRLQNTGGLQVAGSQLIKIMASILEGVTVYRAHL